MRAIHPECQVDAMEWHPFLTFECSTFSKDKGKKTVQNKCFIRHKIFARITPSLTTQYHSSKGFEGNFQYFISIF